MLLDVPTQHNKTKSPPTWAVGQHSRRAVTLDGGFSVADSQRRRCNLGETETDWSCYPRAACAGVLGVEGPHRGCSYMYSVRGASRPGEAALKVQLKVVRYPRQELEA